MTKIAVLVGSLREASFNRRLAEAIAALAPGGITFSWPDIGTLPLYDQDDDDDQAPEVVALKQAVRNADGIIFVTPEYNRSIPGVLKNAIDHASRPKRDSAWRGKPAGVIGTSPGPVGTALAQQHLRLVLACLDMPTLNQPETFVQFTDDTFGPDGKLAGRAADQVGKWLNAYLDHLELHRD